MLDKNSQFIFLAANFENKGDKSFEKNYQKLRGAVEKLLREKCADVNGERFPKSRVYYRELHEGWANAIKFVFEWENISEINLSDQIKREDAYRKSEKILEEALNEVQLPVINIDSTSPPIEYL